MSSESGGGILAPWRLGTGGALNLVAISKTRGAGEKQTHTVLKGFFWESDLRVDRHPHGNVLGEEILNPKVRDENLDHERL